VPIAILLAVPFFALVLAFTLQGMHQGANSWLGPLLAGIVHPRKSFWGKALSIALLPFGPLKQAALNVFYAVEHTITLAATHAMGTAAHWLHGLAAVEQLSQRAIVSFMEAAAADFVRGWTVVLPREVHKVTRPINRKATRAAARAAAAAAAVAALRRWARRVVAHELRPAIHRLTHAVDVTLPRALGRLRTRVGRVETQLRKPSRVWLRRIAAAMWLSYLAGAAVKLLARRFPWLFCRKISDKRTGIGRKLCGMNQDLLDWVFIGTLALNSPFTLEDFARQAVVALDLFVDGLDTILQDIHLAQPDYLGGTAGGLPGAFADYLDGTD
jgi:hypothetical protein